MKEFIEIPFGAKDSELGGWEYNIPEGYTASIENGKIVVKKESDWSEEDETALCDALWCCKQAASIAKDENDMGNIWHAEKWLKSLKERYNLQLKQEWSEEDKGNLLDVKCIIDEIWHSQYVRGEIDRSCEELESLWCWLDDIWQKVEYPQSTWKPSNEQMEALYNLMRYAVNLSVWRELENKIESLYKDLKKLMKE